MAKILAVGSGSGGAGKSTAAFSLAVGAAKRGKRTILLDASGPSRCCDLMLGLESIVVLDMLDVSKHQASIHTALYPVPGRENLRFASASLYDGTSICDLSAVLLVLRTLCDVLVIDLPTGQTNLPEEFFDPCDALILLAVPNDASIRALERTLAGLGAAGGQRYLILNHVNANLVKKRVQYDRKSVEMLLDMPVSAVIAEDERIETGCRKCKPAIEVDRKIAAEFSSLLEEALTAK